MRRDRYSRDPLSDAFDSHSWERDYAIKLLIQALAFDDKDAITKLRKQFDNLEDKRPRCPQCGRRGCEPWNHDYVRNSERAVCAVCYEKGCNPKEHAG